MRHSSCPKMFLVFSSSFCRSLVSKALDMYAENFDLDVVPLGGRC
jgi:hypothetical protein